MPNFSLAAVPGLEGTFTIAENASGVSVQVGLKDSVLFLPGQQRLPLTTSHQRASDGTHLLELTGSFLPARTFLAGQVSLSSLSLTLRFRETPSGMVLDTPAADAAVVTGVASWVGAQVLGFSNPLNLHVSYRLSAPLGFKLALANLPVTIPGGLAEIQAADIVAEFPVDRPVVALLLRGQAGLTSSGLANVSDLLSRLLPSAPQIQPLGFVIRQEFALTNGVVTGLPASPVGTPFFRLDVNWPPGTLPVLANLPAALRVDIGNPSFSSPLGSGSAPTGWTLRLPNTAIRFPNIAALAPFQLLGTLQLETGTANRVAFEPSASGGFELPDPLQFLIGRLGWSGSRTPLDQLEQSANLSVSEFEWQDLFRNLLPQPIPSTGLDLAALGAQLEQALASAIQTAGLELERIFFTAFQGLGAGGVAAYGVLWQKWFAPSTGLSNPFDRLPELLVSMLAMPAAAFDVAVSSLVDVVDDFGKFTAGLLKGWAAAIDTRFDIFLQMATRTLSIALVRLPQPKIDLLGAGLMDALVRLPELQALHALPGLPEMPLGRAVLATSLRNLASGSSPGDGVKLASLFAGLSLASKRADADENERANEVLLDLAAAPESFPDWLLGIVWDAAVRHAMPWWDLLNKPINPQHRGDKLLTLPPGKYLIISDVHRDRLDDVGKQPYDPSISHFQANRALYLNVIEWARVNGYVLIEGGDCEELWFVRREDHSDRAQILRDIIRDNQDVYDKLRELHRNKRYYRIYGNHDSQLRKPGIHSILKTEMQREGAGPFRIYDFIVIDGVKSMVERTALDKFIEMAVGIAQGQTPEQIVRELAKGTVGMDANDYTDTCRMLIMHGHQWDFYNCDPNNIIGMEISNQVAVRVDKAMDPILAMRGLALGGNPWIDFGEVLSKAPVTNCWPSEADAVRLAHEVQHAANSERKLLDSVMYKESLTAITGTFGIALNAPGEITPEQSRENIDVTRPGTILDYLKKHHNHHICIGHTHNPHSQPHFALRSILTGLPYLGNLFTLLKPILPFNPNLFKSKYFNSGTAGWWKGVIWAIQIDETRQARLVFWTNQTGLTRVPERPGEVQPGDPETMDWELTPWPSAVREAFPRTREEFLDLLRRFTKEVMHPEEYKELLQSPIAAPIELFQAALAKGDALFKAAELWLKDFEEGIRQTLKDFEKGIRRTTEDFEAAAALLQTDLLNEPALAKKGNELFKAAELLLKDFEAGIRRLLEDFEAAAASLQTDLLNVLLTLRSRASGFRQTAEDVFSFVVEVKGDVRERIEANAKHIMNKRSDSAWAQALHAAVVADPLLENSRNLVLAGLAAPRFHPERFLFDSESPVLTLFSSIASLFRPAGVLTRIGDQTVTSELSFVPEDSSSEVSQLRLKITMRTDASASTFPDDPIS
jgi:UDP-2,3-diacylglucosamine pyrophosphatase LpxH